MKTSTFIIGKVKRLLLPYCIWGGFFYAIWVLKNWDNRSLEPLLHLVFDNTTGLPIAGALWFLTALFIAEIIYFILNRYIQNEKLRTLTIIMVAFVGNIVLKVIPVRLPYSMDAAFVGVGIIITLLIFQNGIINMRLGWYANIPLFWINSIGAILVGLNISIWLSICKNRIILPVINLLKRIGRNSIVYLCLNQLIIMEVWNAVSLLDRKLSIISIEGDFFREQYFFYQ